MMKLQKGKNEYSEGTSPCDKFGCLYCTDSGRCIYHVAEIQQQISRACHHDKVACEVEARLDYEEGYL